PRPPPRARGSSTGWPWSNIVARPPAAGCARAMAAFTPSGPQAIEARQEVVGGEELVPVELLEPEEHRMARPRHPSRRRQLLGEAARPAERHLVVSAHAKEGQLGVEEGRL